MTAVAPDSRFVLLLRQAKRVLLFTGAGISTGSGIPDYRGPGGVWTRRQPVYYDRFLSSEAARVEYWDYKLEGWGAFSDAKPNVIHASIVRLESAGQLEMVVTQNIDGLHSAAGTSDDRLVEIHGTNGKVECQRCWERSAPGPHFEEFARTGAAPRCHCGGYLKPATISFGQDLRPGDLERSFAAARSCDLVISLGSTLSVTPAATVPLVAAERAGVSYVIVNRGETAHDELDEVSVRLEGDVAAIFPPAVDAALE